MTTLRMGSRGHDVSRLQETLNRAGYGLAVDGAFGAKTAAAVRDYQQKHGLTVDGVAGPRTWDALTADGSLTGSGSLTGAAAASERLSAALDALEPSLSAPFAYDAASDPAYRQYVRQYVRLGRRAMADTLGAAAGLTGGYGSSYAQSAAQQAYHQRLAGLDDVLPALYREAWQRYRDGAAAVREQYKLLLSRQKQAQAQALAEEKAARSAAGGSGGSGRSSSGSGKSSARSKSTARSGADAALAWAAAHPGTPWNSRTVDGYLASSGLSAAEKAVFRATLRKTAPDAGFAR